MAAEAETSVGGLAASATAAQAGVLFKCNNPRCVVGISVASVQLAFIGEQGVKLPTGDHRLGWKVTSAPLGEAFSVTVGGATLDRPIAGTTSRDSGGLRHLTVAGLLACLWLVPGVARAQAPATPSAVQEKAFDSLSAPSNLPLGTLAGSAVAGGNVAMTELLLEGTEAEGVATAAVGWTRGSSQFRLKFSSPINKSTKEATLLTLDDGLPSGATAELSISNLFWANADEADLAAFEELCVRSGQPRSCDIGELNEASKPEGRRLLKIDDTPLFLGATASLSRKTFDYLDATLADQSEDHLSGSAVVRVGAFSRIFGFGFLSYAYEERWLAGGSPQNICRPIGVEDAFACGDAIRGAPTKKVGSVLGGELRRYFGAAIAVAPSLRYDFKNKVTAVAVPLYFLRNKDGSLTGGVRASWRSDTEAVKLLVFVGTAFSLK